MGLSMVCRNAKMTRYIMTIRLQKTDWSWNISDFKREIQYNLKASVTELRFLVCVMFKISDNCCLML